MSQMTSSFQTLFQMLPLHREIRRMPKLSPYEMVMSLVMQLAEALRDCHHTRWSCRQLCSWQRHCDIVTRLRYCHEIIFSGYVGYTGRVTNDGIILLTILRYVSSIHCVENMRIRCLMRRYRAFRWITGTICNTSEISCHQVCLFYTHRHALLVSLSYAHTLFVIHFFLIIIGGKQTHFRTKWTV